MTTKTRRQMCAFGVVCLYRNPDNSARQPTVLYRDDEANLWRNSAYRSNPIRKKVFRGTRKTNKSARHPPGVITKPQHWGRRIIVRIKHNAKKTLVVLGLAAVKKSPMQGLEHSLGKLFCLLLYYVLPWGTDSITATKVSLFSCMFDLK